MHKRNIRHAFAMGRTEVTNAQFGAFVEETGYRPSQACTKWRGEVVMFGGDNLSGGFIVSTNETREYATFAKYEPFGASCAVAGALPAARSRVRS